MTKFLCLIGLIVVGIGVATGNLHPVAAMGWGGVLSFIGLIAVAVKA